MEAFGEGGGSTTAHGDVDTAAYDEHGHTGLVHEHSVEKQKCKQKLCFHIKKK